MQNMKAICREIKICGIYEVGGIKEKIKIIIIKILLVPKEPIRGLSTLNTKFYVFKPLHIPHNLNNIYFILKVTFCNVSMKLEHVDTLYIERIEKRQKTSLTLLKNDVF